MRDVRSSAQSSDGPDRVSPTGRLTGAGTPFDPATLRFGRFGIEGWIDVAEMVNAKPAKAP